MSRIVVIARAHLAGEWLGERGARLPVAPIAMQGFIAAVLCGLARSELTPFPYGIFALSVTLGLTTLPLLGELGPLLRADPAAEWIGAQPVRPGELRAARVLVIAVLLGGLALGTLIPAALLAPGELGLLGRVWLIAAGLLQTYFVAALLLWLQGLLGKRADGVLVLVQTALFVGVIVGLFAGLRLLPELAAVRGATPPGLLAYPPAWFASPLLGWGHHLELGLILTAVAVTVATFLFAPFPPASPARRTTSPLATLLSPLRRLATRVWVRPEERGPFDFLYDALPAERDFVIRTYPLVAVPLAFLLLGADPATTEGEGLFALLLFAPATYLPVMLVFVPGSATPRARWLLDTSPMSLRDEDGGGAKALAVRLLVPLYLGLSLVVWLQAGWELTLRLAPPAAVAGFVALRVLWPRYVHPRPLSTHPSELGSAWRGDWSGSLLVTAVAMTGLAIFCWRVIDTPAAALSVLALWLVLELGFARRPRRVVGSIVAGGSISER